MKRIIASLVVCAAFASCSYVRPYTATNNTIGDKVGKSETICLFNGDPSQLSFGIVLNKNYGVVEAAQNGGISSVATMDLEVQNFFIFTKNTIIVTGE